MAATIAMTMTLGTTAVFAPQAMADDVQRILVGKSTDDVMGAYEKLPAADLQKLQNGQVQAVWCIDYSNRGVPENMEVRKLTGQSGAYGTDLTIDPDIEKAAINVTKELIKAHKAGDDVREQKMNFILQGLLGNNLGYLNKVRSNILDGKRDSVNGMLEGPSVRASEFTQLTGFRIERRQTDNRVGKRDGQTNYMLVKNLGAFAQVEANYKPGEYVTVVVPKGYTLDQTRQALQLPQRYITIEQPGLDITVETPKPTLPPKPPAPKVEQNTEIREERTTHEYHYHYNYYQRTYVFTYQSSRDFTVDVNVGGNWTYEVAQGGNLVVVEKRNGQLVVTPKPGANGDVIIWVTDANGNKYQYCLTVNNTTRTVEDAATIVVGGGNNNGQFQIPNGGSWTIINGQEWVDTQERGGRLIITPKPGSHGKNVVVEITDANGHKVKVNVTIVVKTTSQNYVGTTINGGSLTIENRTSWTFESGQDLVNVREEGGKLIVEGKPGKNGVAVIVVTDQWGNTYRYTVNVVNSIVVDVRSFQLIDGAQNDSTVRNAGNWTHRVVSGAEFVEVTRKGDTLTVKGKNDQNGTAVVELLNDKGFVFGRYTYYVSATPAVQAQVVNENITDQQIFHIQRGASTNKLTLISGGDLVDRKGTGDWTLTPKQGANGTVVVEERNSRGQLLTTYNITITPVQIKEITGTITTTQRATLTGTNLVITSGHGLADLTKEGGQWKLTPKNPGTVIIEDRDRDGRVIARYIFTITPGEKKVYEIEQTITVENTYTTTIEGNSTHKVIEGSDLVNVTVENGTLKVTPKDGKSGTVIIEVTNPNGDIGRHTIIIEDQNVPPATDRNKGGTITIIDKNPGKGSFTVETPGQGGGTITIKDGDKDVTGEYDIKDNGDGTFTIIRKDGQPLPGNLKVSWTSPDGKNVTNYVNVTIFGGGSSKGEGSSDPKCIGAISLLSLPLLLAIPVGILSQVQIPGFEHVHAQLNAALREVNSQIQKGLGVFNENQAAAAANVEAAAANVAPLAGMAAAAVGLLAVTAGATAGVLEACGVVDLKEASSK